MSAKLDGTNGLLQQYDYQVLTTGFSYTFAAGVNVLVMNPVGTLATGTITMPAAPADGMTISFSSTQAITALTVNANTGQSIVGAPTSLSAGGGASFIYRLANTTWYAQASSASSGIPTTTAYTSPGTYTKTAGLKAIKVTVVGGGGSAPGVGPAGVTVASGGGGGGGSAILVYPAPSLPASAVPYTVGTAGGTSSFGAAPLTVISATGGANGGLGTNSASGGAGGAGSNGSINATGGGGGAGIGPVGLGGAGGSSIFGGGAYGRFSTGGGIAGNPYGGGAGGAATPGAVQPGGTGASGVVIIEEFY